MDIPRLEAYANEALAAFGKTKGWGGLSRIL